MIDVVVPKWGLTMEDATIGEWLVAVGDSVTEGDALVEIETDKVTNDLPSPATGTLVEILHEQGAIVEPGQVVARIGAP